MTVFRKLSPVFLAATFVLLTSTVSFADSLFFDDFQRGTGTTNTVGNNWVETEEDSNDVAIITLSGSNRVLQLRDEDNSCDACAAQLALSTAGYQNIKLNFDWSAISASDSGDRLYVEWKLSNDGSWIQLGQYDLAGASTLASVTGLNLGSSAADSDNPPYVQIRFRTSVGDEDEGAYVDNVRLTGDIIKTPEANPLLLMSLGLMGIVGFKLQTRRKQLPSEIR